ncbi:MAG TPA: hypothetical protein VGD58_31870 [Herpetosiphonaceae bacterium]
MTRHKTSVRRVMSGRLAIALSLGIAGALLCYLRLTALDRGAGDLSWSLRGATELWSGHNPYHDPALGPGKPYPFNDALFYPLPALLIAMPLTPAPLPLAGAVFAGVSVGLLAWGIGRDHWRLWPLLLSAPLWSAVFTVQWSPLITAAALLPALLPLTLAKPNVGLPMLLAAPTRRSLVWSAVIVGLSVVILPSWPGDWLRNARQHTVFVPALVFPGMIVLLAVWRWHDPRARLLLLTALMPQRAIYDQLGLWLTARSWRQALLLSIGSWITLIGWWLGPAAVQRWIVVWMYLPAFAIVMWPTVQPLVVTMSRRIGRDRRTAAAPVLADQQ